MLNSCSLLAVLLEIGVFYIEDTDYGAVMFRGRTLSEETRTKLYAYLGKYDAKLYDIDGTISEFKSLPQELQDGLIERMDCVYKFKSDFLGYSPSGVINGEVLSCTYICSTIPNKILSFRAKNKDTDRILVSDTSGNFYEYIPEVEEQGWDNISELSVGLQIINKLQHGGEGYPIDFIKYINGLYETDIYLYKDLYEILYSSEGHKDAYTIMRELHAAIFYTACCHKFTLDLTKYGLSFYQVGYNITTNCIDINRSTRGAEINVRNLSEFNRETVLVLAAFINESRKITRHAETPYKDDLRKLDIFMRDVEVNGLGLKVLERQFTSNKATIISTPEKSGANYCVIRYSNMRYFTGVFATNVKLQVAESYSALTPLIDQCMAAYNSELLSARELADSTGHTVDTTDAVEFTVLLKEWLDCPNNTPVRLAIMLTEDKKIDIKHFNELLQKDLTAHRGKEQ